jgi:PmbA protein
MSTMREVAERAVQAALASGAADAEAYASEAKQREVRAHGGKLESLAAATQRGLGVRVWSGGRVGYAFGTDLSRQGVAEIAAEAADIARLADPDEFAGPPTADGPESGLRTSEIGPPAEIDGLSDPDLAAWPTERVAELALAVERAAVGHDERVRGVEQAVYVDSAESVAIAASTGAGGEYRTSSCYAYTQALAGGDAGRETGLGFGLGRGPGSLDAAAIGREAAERATAMIGAVKPASRVCPVALDATVAASFVGLLGKALGADAVQRGRSPLASLLGERVAADAFVLNDDGLVPEGFGSAPIDAEGLPQRRTALVEGGTLLSFLYDAYTARRGEAVSTGNAGRSGYRAPPAVAASNLIVEPGAMSTDELLAEAGEGVYVTDVAGLHSGVNPVTGVFSVGASGRAIRGGEPAEPLREFTIAGDLVSMLRSVRAAGAAARWVPFGGSVRTPPLLIGEMTVAGA